MSFRSVSAFFCALAWAAAQIPYQTVLTNTQVTAHRPVSLWPVFGAVASGNLQSYWPLSENTGSTAFDYSTGTLGNPCTWRGTSPFYSGYAGSFNGTDQLADCGNVLNSIITGANAQFTILAWVKPALNNLTANMIVAKAANSSCAANQRQFDLSLGASSKLEFEWYGALTSGSVRDTAGSTAITDTSHWYHLAVRYDGTNATINSRVTMWVDGTQETTSIVGSSGSPSTIQTGTSHLGIGNLLSASGTACGSMYWKGQIAGVRIYSGLLPASEIARASTQTPGRVQIAPLTYTQLLLMSDRMDLATLNGGLTTSGQPATWYRYIPWAKDPGNFPPASTVVPATDPIGGSAAWLHTEPASTVTPKTGFGGMNRFQNLCNITITSLGITSRPFDLTLCSAGSPVSASVFTKSSGSIYSVVEPEDNDGSDSGICYPVLVKTDDCTLPVVSTNASLSASILDCGSADGACGAAPDGTSITAALGAGWCKVSVTWTPATAQPSIAFGIGVGTETADTCRPDRYGDPARSVKWAWPMVGGTAYQLRRAQ